MLPGAASTSLLCLPLQSTTKSKGPSLAPHKERTLTVSSQCCVVASTSKDVWMQTPAAVACSKRTGGRGGGGGGGVRAVDGERQNVHGSNCSSTREQRRPVHPNAIRALAQNVIVQVKDATVIDSPAIQTLHFGAQLQYVSERADVRENGEACGHDIGAVHTACAQPAGGAHQPVGCSSRPLPSGCATANFSGKQTVKFGR